MRALHSRRKPANPTTLPFGCNSVKPIPSGGTCFPCSGADGRNPTPLQLECRRHANHIGAHTTQTFGSSGSPAPTDDLSSSVASRTCGAPGLHADVLGHLSDQAQAVQRSLVDAAHLVVHEQARQQHRQREDLRAVLPRLRTSPRFDEIGIPATVADPDACTTAGLQVLLESPARCSAPFGVSERGPGAQHRVLSGTHACA